MLEWIHFLSHLLSAEPVAAYLCKHNACYEEKNYWGDICWRLRRPENQADTNVSVSVKLGIIMSKCQTFKIEDVCV